MSASQPPVWSVVIDVQLRSGRFTSLVTTPPLAMHVRESVQAHQSVDQASTDLLPSAEDEFCVDPATPGRGRRGGVRVMIA